MQSTAATIFSLSSADVSSILNLICRGCGGPLGAMAEEYRCPASAGGVGGLPG